MPSAGHGRVSGAERVTLGLNSVEIERLAVFAAAHKGCASGGWPARFEVESVATGIGSAMTVSCKGCGASEDFSDRDSW